MALTLAKKGNCYINMSIFKVFFWPTPFQKYGSPSSNWIMKPQRMQKSIKNQHVNDYDSDSMIASYCFQDETVTLYIDTIFSVKKHVKTSKGASRVAC